MDQGYRMFSRSSNRKPGKLHDARCEVQKAFRVTQGFTAFPFPPFVCLFVCFFFLSDFLLYGEYDQMKATNKFPPVACQLILNFWASRTGAHFPSEKTAQLRLRGHPKTVATFSLASLLLSEIVLKITEEFISL